MTSEPNPESEQAVEELHERYQELAVKCADSVVRGEDPKEQKYYDELETLFLELAHREEQDEIPEKERQLAGE